VLVELAYLRSYERMGIGIVRCERGCSCEETLMDGHHNEKNSQVGGAAQGHMAT
jgi:DNA polymerase alpha subunit B